MQTDPIIEELHDFREEIMEECKSKGMTYAEYFNSQNVRDGMIKVKAEPKVIDFSQLESLMSEEAAEVGYRAQSSS